MCEEDDVRVCWRDSVEVVNRPLLLVVVLGEAASFMSTPSLPAAISVRAVRCARAHYYLLYRLQALFGFYFLPSIFITFLFILFLIN